jgi:hypothetical protein
VLGRTGIAVLQRAKGLVAEGLVLGPTRGFIRA